MAKCLLCGDLTPCVVNIKFRAVPVCEACCWSVTRQTVADHKTPPRPDAVCQIRLRNAGKAFPRTCPTCGFRGQCKLGLTPEAGK
jgi:hypothetical protein